jgi:tRNA A-37 threonylcarbamoyl transferase component Bud32
MVAPSPECVVNDDGSITIQGKRIRLREAFLEEVIGSGANGFVVRGRHRLLSVPLAVKFWVSLRRRDSRDKMAQGIAEVRKLEEAYPFQSVIMYRSCGESAGIFYAIMNLFTGQTLESWIKDSHPLGLRRRIACRLVDEVCGLAHGGLYHGDLHARNVLVDTRATSRLDGVEPRFGIIDFGTSLFASRRTSRARHWRVFAETMDRLVSPFELHRLARTSFPARGTAESVRAWFHACLASIRHALIQLGAAWLIDPEESHACHRGERDSLESKLSELFPVASPALALTKRLIEDGSLTVSKECLGPGDLWWPRCPRFDSATADGVGPPWSTSMTDETWWKKGGAARSPEGGPAGSA